MPTIEKQRRSWAALFFGATDGRTHTATFFLVASLFLLWGCCNGMINVMDKHFQDLLHLSKAQSAWVQTAHYTGYALMAFPAGLLARAIGYKGGIISGLVLVAVGGFWFVAATHIAAFWAFLLGVCLIAMGLTVLETVANPYTTVLGPPRFAAFRINLAQSFNGVGSMTGPIIGGAFFYAAGGAGVAQGRLYIPYAAIAVVALVLGGIFFISDVPDLVPHTYQRDDSSAPSADPVASSPNRSIWTHPHFVGGVLAQFLYVAAQAGIFSFFINYMVAETPSLSTGWSVAWLAQHGMVAHTAHGWSINEQGAARLQGLVGFGLFTVGRLSGSALLGNARPDRVLGTYSFANVILCALVVAKLGWLSVAAVFGTFFFMSISFPTIFALGIDGLGPKTKKASAFLVMAILGGALMPKVMGHVGDLYNMSVAFWVPLACFALIALYGYAWRVLSVGAVASSFMRSPVEETGATL